MSELSDEEKQLPLLALIGLVLGKVLSFTLISSIGMYLLQYQNANAIDYAMVKCLLLSMAFFIKIKLKGLDHSDVPRYAWPWIII